MSHQNMRPKWWQLYLILPLLIGLFAVDFRLKLSTRGHQIVQIGILLFIWGLTHLWLKANEAALSKLDDRHPRKFVMFVQKPLPDKRSILQLPDSEIKGVLNDTFEIDIIDTEFLPSEETPQELEKE